MIVPQKILPSEPEGRCLAAAALDCNSIRLFTTLFSSTFSRQGFLHALLLARLQVEGVTPDLLDDVFLLHFALEATKGILQRLALLQSNFRQTHHLPTGTQCIHSRVYFICTRSSSN
jgi:hypothetical protein